MRKHSLATIARRRERLIPGGVPRYLRCYDNHGTDRESADRYTAVYTGRNPVAVTVDYRGIRERWFPYVTMSENPYHPQGVGIHDSNAGQPIDTIKYGKPGWAWPPAVGRKCFLGVRITFMDLPSECRHLVMRDYEGIWNCSLPGPRWYVRPSRDYAGGGGDTCYFVCDSENEIPNDDNRLWFLDSNVANTLAARMNANPAPAKPKPKPRRRTPPSGMRDGRLLRSIMLD